ncbi:ABC transporter permease [Bifidobacterium sp. MA2]|uniref:ABC transporter permease n=1 Tax=Bifidobacterium santillanense TaxID=2809028 RepID=A0ABS5UM59_9BIFI|nr:ABC transporter permease [Bifidobacterium santillanense]MBT1171958.1 ABC transporter permease [Bifidobacterium santillanense]
MTYANTIDPMTGPSAGPDRNHAVPRAYAAARRGPSVRAAFRWETRKAGNLWYWIAVVLFDAIGMFNGWSQYVDYRAEFTEQGVTWAAVWGQAILLPSMVFMPMLTAAFAAQIEANEHRGRNWRRLNAVGAADVAVAGKMLHGLTASLLTVLVFEAEFILVGRLAAGFDLADLGPFLIRGVPLTLSVWAIMTLTQAAGAKAESFAGTMSVMMLLTIGGCALSIAAPAVARAYPLALITGASAVRDLADVADPVSMLVSTIVAATWVAIGALLFRRLARRAV